MIWYLRNSIFFDLQLETNPKVMLCRYEDLVQDPEQRFRKLFEFVEAKYSPKYTADVHAGSVHKTSDIRINPEIQELCERTLVRLDAEYENQVTSAGNALKAT